MACNMNETQVMLGFAFLIGAGFIGKLFCSFVCPIGTITEWIGRLGGKWNLRRDLHPKADRVLRSLKYGILYVSVYYTMTSGELFCKKYDPYFAMVQLFGNRDIVIPLAVTALVITLGGALFLRHFWCK